MEKQFGIFRLNTEHRLTLKKKSIGYWVPGGELGSTNGYKPERMLRDLSV